MHVSYDQWINGTRLALHRPRSAPLKAVNRALKQYDRLQTRKQLKHLERAFGDWKAAKGPHWEKGPRNKKGMITALHNMLTLPKSELTPMEFVLNEQQRRINTLFRQRELVGKKHPVRRAFAANQLRNVGQGVQAVAPDVRGRFDSMMGTVLSQFFDAASDREIKMQIAEELGETFFGEFVKSMTPYMGLITAGSSAVYQWGKTAQSYYRRTRVAHRAEVTRAGDPRRAVDAIGRIIQREINEHGTKATISTVEFGVKGLIHAAGAGAAGDTVIGGLTGFAKLTHTIHLVGRDYVEKRDANRIMKGPDDISHRLFDVCPIVGCYYVVCVDTSDIINFMIEDMGTDGWMDTVEELNKHLSVIIVQARRLINESRFVIANMPKLKMSDDQMRQRGIEVSRKDKFQFGARRVRGKVPI